MQKIYYVRLFCGAIDFEFIFIEEIGIPHSTQQSESEDIRYMEGPAIFPDLKTLDHIRTLWEVLR